MWAFGDSGVKVQYKYKIAQTRHVNVARMRDVSRGKNRLMQRCTVKYLSLYILADVFILRLACRRLSLQLL